MKWNECKFFSSNGIQERPFAINFPAKKGQCNLNASFSRKVEGKKFFKMYTYRDKIAITFSKAWSTNSGDLLVQQRGKRKIYRFSARKFVKDLNLDGQIIIFKWNPREKKFVGTNHKKFTGN